MCRLCNDVALAQPPMRRQTSTISWLDLTGPCLRATAVYSSHFGPTIVPWTFRQALIPRNDWIRGGRRGFLEVSGSLDRPALAENRAG
jgi:hypothetical protein